MSPGIIVFVMEGCGACEEFLPRLHAAARQEGVRLNVYDVNDQGRGTELANEYRVRATPTTVGRSVTGALRRRVGGVDDAALGRFVASLGRG